MSGVGPTIAPAETIPLALDHTPVPTRELLSSVCEELRPELGRFIRALGIDAVRAEDVLQDVHLAAWSKPPPELDREGLRKWLYRVTANRCYLEHRRARRWRAAWEGLSRLWPDSQAASEPLSEQEELEFVRRAIDDLDPVRKSIIVMRYFRDMDSKEIGEILELPHSTVRSHLRLARRRLAGVLGRMKAEG